jgi:hypothetical protein
MFLAAETRLPIHRLHVMLHIKEFQDVAAHRGGD